MSGKDSSQSQEVQVVAPDDTSASPKAQMTSIKIRAHLKAYRWLNDISFMTDWRTLVREVAMEYLVTLIFVYFLTTTAVMENYYYDPITNGKGYYFIVGIVGGLTILALIYISAHVSGGHINPIVSVAFFVCGKMHPLKCILYICAQVLGAFSGSLATWGTTSFTEVGLLGVNEISPELNLGNAVLAEFMGSFFLVLTILFTAMDERSVAKNAAPAAIGLALLTIHFALIPLTGCGCNPARTLGPAIVLSLRYMGSPQQAASWSTVWVYIAAPFFGGFCAALVAVGYESNRTEDSGFGDGEADVGYLGGEEVNKLRQVQVHESFSRRMR